MKNPLPTSALFSPCILHCAAEPVPPYILSNLTGLLVFMVKFSQHMTHRSSDIIKT